MSYVDEVLEKVVAKNPAEPEFHQAVKEVLESLRVVVEANEEKFRKDALLERLVKAGEIRFLPRSRTGTVYPFENPRSRLYRRSHKGTDRGQTYQNRQSSKDRARRFLTH